MGNGGEEIEVYGSREDRIVAEIAVAYPSKKWNAWQT